MRPFMLQNAKAMGVECAHPHLLNNRIPAVAEQGGQTQAHLVGGFFRERGDKDALRVHAFGKEAGSTAGQNCGLARPCPCQHQSWAVIVKECLKLLRVQTRFKFWQERFAAELM